MRDLLLTIGTNITNELFVIDISRAKNLFISYGEEGEIALVNLKYIY